MAEKDERLISAINTIAEIINETAAAMKRELCDGDCKDIKQLKELTLAAKELAAVMRSLDNDTTKDSAEQEITVSFEGEGETWAE